MKVVPLGEIVQVKGGGTPRKSCPDFFGGQVPWVTPKDMKKWRISDSSVRLTLAGVENSPARIVEPGSVLVVVRSGVLKHTLPVALTTAAVTVNQDLKALTPTREACGVLGTFHQVEAANDPRLGARHNGRQLPDRQVAPTASSAAAARRAAAHRRDP